MKKIEERKRCHWTQIRVERVIEVNDNYEIMKKKWNIDEKWKILNWEKIKDKIVKKENTKKISLKKSLPPFSPLYYIFEASDSSSNTLCYSIKLNLCYMTVVFGLGTLLQCAEHKVLPIGKEVCFRNCV